jgi:DNA-binding ferritin-like protein (Dps family)
VVKKKWTSVKDDADVGAVADDRKEGRQHKKYAQHLSLKFESIFSVVETFLWKGQMEFRQQAILSTDISSSDISITIFYVSCKQTSVKDDADSDAIADDRKEGRQHKKYAQHLSLKFKSIFSSVETVLRKGQMEFRQHDILSTGISSSDISPTILLSPVSRQV